MSEGILDWVPYNAGDEHEQREDGDFEHLNSREAPRCGGQMAFSFVYVYPPNIRTTFHSGSGMKALRHSLPTALLIYAAAVLGLAAASPADPSDWAANRWTQEHAGRSVDLSGYRLSFNDDFDEFDCVGWAGSPAGAHKWYSYGSVGYGRSAGCDQKESTYSLAQGALELTVARYEGAWRMGEIASYDLSGEGFSQTYGYFVARIKLPSQIPAGLRVWPAFWLQGKLDRDPTYPFTEIDVLENFGTDLSHNLSTLHVWPPKSATVGGAIHLQKNAKYPASLYDDRWHTYGLRWTEQWYIVDIDGLEVARVSARSAEPARPMGLVLDLALSGAPEAAAGTKYTMYVDYVRAYRCIRREGCSSD